MPVQVSAVVLGWQIAAYVAYAKMAISNYPWHSSPVTLPPQRAASLASSPTMKWLPYSMSLAMAYITCSLSKWYKVCPVLMAYVGMQWNYLASLWNIVVGI